LDNIDTYRLILGQCVTSIDFDALYEMINEDWTLKPKLKSELIHEYLKYRDHHLHSNK
jgi:hypothetical protein